MGQDSRRNKWRSGGRVRARTVRSIIEAGKVTCLPGRARDRLRGALLRHQTFAVARAKTFSDALPDGVFCFLCRSVCEHGERVSRAGHNAAFWNFGRPLSSARTDRRPARFKRAPAKHRHGHDRSSRLAKAVRRPKSAERQSAVPPSLPPYRTHAAARPAAPARRLLASSGRCSFRRETGSAHWPLLGLCRAARCACSLHRTSRRHGQVSWQPASREPRRLHFCSEGPSMGCRPFRRDVPAGAAACLEPTSCSAMARLMSG